MPPILAYHVRQYWPGIALYGHPVFVGKIAAYRRTRIHWKKETRVFDLIIQAHPRHRGLDNHVHAALQSVQTCVRSQRADLLIRMQFYNLVHEAKVDAHAAKWSREVRFEA